MPGWPLFEECFLWQEELDGEEPYYMDDSAICKPALRLQPPTHPSMSEEEPHKK